MPEQPLRPRDFALLLLSADDLPRQRARDQQADRAGMMLRRQVLGALVAADPEPEEMEAALLAIVAEAGQPSGPARAIARGLLEEWQAVSAAPGCLAHLLDEAIRQTGEKRDGHGGQFPG